MKAEGKRLGRPKGFRFSHLAGEEEHIAYLMKSRVTKAEMARIYGVHWSTINRFIKNRMDEYILTSANDVVPAAI